MPSPSSELPALQAQRGAEFIVEHFRNVSTWLGARPDLIADFLKGDDWSLVIRATAITEAALDSAIVATLGREEIADSVAAIPIGERRYGKLRLAQKLGIIQKGDETAGRALCELRNKLAHGVRRIGFTFSDMAPEEFKNLLSSLYGDGSVTSRTSEVHRTVGPGLIILIRTSVIWAQCLIASTSAKRDREIMEAKLNVFRSLNRRLGDLDV